MNITSKINEIFGLKKVKDAQGSKVWIVSWDARYGEWSDSKSKVAKAFLDYDDAQKFAQSLRDARKLLQYTENIHISIEEQS